MTMQLYKLTGALAQVWEQINDEEANLDTLEDTLSCIEGEIEVKIEGMGRMIAMLDADAGVLEAEIKRMTARKQARKNRIDRIKNYIQTQMELMGRDKIETPVLTVALQKNPPALDVFDVMAIPTEYLVHIPAHEEPDKAKIKDALKAGKEIPGCALTQGRSLRLR